MSVKLDRVNVGRGESIIVQIDGSAEVSLFVVVDDEGRCTVSGPPNVLKQEFAFGEQGLLPRFAVVDTGLRAEVTFLIYPLGTDPNETATVDLDFSGWPEGPKFKETVLRRSGNRIWFGMASGPAGTFPVVVDAEEQTLMIGNLLFHADLEPLAILVH
jgi:hypothetical protein